MLSLTKAQKARIAIRIIKTTSDALALRGYYKPSGRSGQTLADGLRMLSPEIYGSMSDPRMIELKGMEYVIDRLPRGIETCNRIILTAGDELEGTSFEKVIPPKRRRTSYRLSEKEICFVITRGLSEIYDILTHITFLNIEALKIRNQIRNRDGDITHEWKEIEKIIQTPTLLNDANLDQALWNLSIILGRTFHETKATYRYLERYSDNKKDTHVLFQIIYGLGKRSDSETESRENELLVYFTPSLKEMIGTQNYSQRWADNIKTKICELNLSERPLHIISANLHSVQNLLYGYAAAKKHNTKEKRIDIYSYIPQIRKKGIDVTTVSHTAGLYTIPDVSGTHIDCQLIDTQMLESVVIHPELKLDMAAIKKEKAVILVMDYAFGTQAFEVMGELLEPFSHDGCMLNCNVRSISIMGKAGILPGKKGDIMLATAHVFEGDAHNYIVNNDLKKEDFDGSIDVYEGSMVTVFGTSLQNQDLLKRFYHSSWRAIGLEMEGGHYQKAINSAIIRQHIPFNVNVRYAYYASDNPMHSGQTLASGSMGEEGVRPTYMITKVILEKILGPSAQKETYECDTKTLPEHASSK